MIEVVRGPSKKYLAQKTQRIRNRVATMWYMLDPEVAVNALDYANALDNTRDQID